MRRWFRHRWLVACDDERRSFPTRAEAREYAARLNRHPSNADIRRFGPYRNVDGTARVIDLGGPNPYRDPGRPAYHLAEAEAEGGAS